MTAHGKVLVLLVKDKVPLIGCPTDLGYSSADVS